MNRTQPAWRQPMLWLVAALPLASIAAAAATIAVALGDGGTDTVDDAVRRIAQVQIAESHADAAAARRGIRLRLERDGDGVRARLIDGDVDPRTSLRLVLRHPARASGDVALRMQPHAGISDVEGASAPTLRLKPLPQGERAGNAAVEWHTTLRFDVTHDWNIELSGEDWRVVGRWKRGAATAGLAPAWPSTVTQ